MATTRGVSFLVPGNHRIATFDVPIIERVVVPATPASLVPVPTAGEIVRAAFAAALDGEIVDSRFLNVFTAASVIEAQVMLTYQRPLTARDQIQIGIESALENNRRHPEKAAAFHAEREARYDDGDDNGDNVAVGDA